MGKRLIIIAAGVSVVPLLAACAAGAGSPRQHSHVRALGTVTGTFEREGGPLGPGGTQPKGVPLSGTIMFTAADGRPVLVRVGKSGTFTVRLAAGSYRVLGRSPQIGGSGGRAPWCSVPLTVAVSAGHAARAKVVCPVP
jgi:hypothetical protein